MEELMDDPTVSVHDVAPTRPTLFDFDAYMCQQLGGSGTVARKVARHKLLYAVQRLSIATTGKRAFDARCEAWALGPVFVELQKHPDRVGNPSALSAADRQLCETVLAKIGHLSGKELAIRSHRRYPEWRAARKGLKPTECGHREISPGVIRAMTYEQLRVEGDKIIFEANHNPGLALRQFRDLIRQPNLGA
jgi:uncharacterized phage-associated protein